MQDIEMQRGPLNEPVGDYTFQTNDGVVSLSELFGEKSDLIVIHNMGRGCAYCTMWADGFNGLLPHLESRAAFVVASPDEPKAQSEFARSRGWRFRMVSTRGSSFTEDMGFQPKPNEIWPGVSCFRKLDDGSIVRTGKVEFCPGDSFNPAWHFFALLAEGANGWQPKLSYDGSRHAKEEVRS